jgi:hypothetical protein
MIARDPSKPTSEQKQAWKECMDYILRKAEKEGVPVWIETASWEGREEYLGLGFRLCEEVVLGKGRVDERGWPVAGGNGVKAWAMIFEGH